MPSLAWKPWALPKCKIFALLIIQNRMWTTNRLAIRGWQNFGLCSFVTKLKTHMPISFSNAVSQFVFVPPWKFGLDYIMLILQVGMLCTHEGMVDAKRSIRPAIQDSFWEQCSKDYCGDHFHCLLRYQLLVRFIWCLRCGRVTSHDGDSQMKTADLARASPAASLKQLSWWSKALSLLLDV
jgi:hypothetical protein